MVTRIEIRLNGLRTQTEMLQMLRRCYMDWAHEDISFELKQAHVEIVETLGALLKKYAALLVSYEKSK